MKPRVLLLAIAGMLIAVPAGFGVISTAAAQAADDVLEEVVVTARKREENLLEVPVSITAITASDIDAKGITDFDDLVDFTPGFFFAEHSVGRGDRSNRLLVIRGMRIESEDDHVQPAMVFVDGAPMMGSVISGLEDAERVEVVKGPQSAYFGRATFSGAVNFVTKTPSDELQGKITAEAGRYGTTSFGAQVEGPLSEGLSYRVSGSAYSTDGHYRLGNDPDQKLGERKTWNLAATLYATPSEQFSAKLRVHTWRDDDGPGAAFAYGEGNGEHYFNCNPPGSTLLERNGGNTWICGEAPFPQPGEINADFVLNAAKEGVLNGVSTPGRPGIVTPFDPPILDGFGLARRAWNASLIMDYEFTNEISLASISAFHSNEWQVLDDVDRRATAHIADLRDTGLLNNRDLRDFSQELRLSADQGRWRWQLGANYFDTTGVRSTGLKFLFWTQGLGVGNSWDIQTTGLFGSIGYDLTDQLSVSVEGRQQWDKVAEGGATGTAKLSDTFTSFTPRVIVDFKATEDITLYASFAQGTRPGTFNANLVGRSQQELDQIQQQTGAGLTVPEEELDSFEVGLKGSLLDGRAWVTATLYWADWKAQSATGVFVTAPDGSTDFVGIKAVGGEIDLNGFELEGVLALTDQITVDATFSVNDSEIKKGGSCSHCPVLLGVANADGLGKRTQKNPKNQGSLGLAYTDQFNEQFDWYARLDYIMTGSRFAGGPNLTETGDSHRVNVRAGVENETWRAEVFGKNVFDDKTFTNYQILHDFAFLGPRRILTAGLPDRAVWGVRASYNF